jgi:hypothetical protein
MKLKQKGTNYTILISSVPGGTRECFACDSGTRELRVKITVLGHHLVRIMGCVGPAKHYLQILNNTPA